MKYNGTILDSGLGSKDRRAALVAAVAAFLPEVHGNSDTGKALSAILADAEVRLAARLARKAERAASSDDAEPVAEPVAEPSKPRKPSKAAKVKAGGKASKVRKNAGSVPCMACFKQTPLDTATVYTEGHVCPACEAESTE